jgi:hypothetical protein
MKKIKTQKNKDQNRKKKTIWEIVIEGLNWKQITIL